MRRQLVPWTLVLLVGCEAEPEPVKTIPAAEDPSLALVVATAPAPKEDPCAEDSDETGDGIPDEHIVYTLDDEGRAVSTRGTRVDGEPGRAETYAYDNAGRIARYTFGTVGAPPVSTLEWFYDPVGRLVEHRNTTDLPEEELVTVDRTRYGEFDAAGKPARADRDEAGKLSVIRYRYDDRARLVEKTVDLLADGTIDRTTGVVYDDLARRSVTTDHADGVDTRIRTRTYDVRGRLVTDEIDDLARHFHSIVTRRYDDEGHLVSLGEAGGWGSVYHYDCD